ncbi:NF-kappa-B inhibitor epsilon-like [Mercenaria mercenaria]|uniref:NF-kappa-B inhibitor epsilon-like n=1 Tax=Mercenaria mercenaria TaxID=6596 RepID=UPI00234EFD7E|nr:NF-kappa-B inhibitor epsilon-like [Mercenaria mercenaria]
MTMCGHDGLPNDVVMVTIMNADPMTLYTKDEDGDTKLHIAIILGMKNLALSLISEAPDYKWLSLANKLYQTPLHLAVITNQPEVIRRLVVAGSDVTSQDKDGNTPLHIACRDRKMTEVISLIEPVNYSETIQNNYEIPYQNIPQDFSISNYQGLTCFHLAASGRHFDIMKVLIKNGTDVNMKEGKSGRTVLHSACESGDIELVQFLQGSRTCDTNARALDGRTPYDLARARGHEDICLALAAAGSEASYYHCDN